MIDSDGLPARVGHWLRQTLDLERRPGIEVGLLLAITLLAAALRLYRLGDWSLWGDEAFTLWLPDDGFRVPLTSALIHWITGTLSVSEWSARLVPALIGVATVPLLYLPIRRIFGRPVALVSAILLAVSTWHLYWSQNARFYTALLLLFNLALLTFYLALEEDRPWLMLASLVFLGLAANERLLALFFVPVAAAYLGLLWLLHFERPRGLRWRNLAIYLVPGAAVTAFLVGPYMLNLRSWVVNFGNANNTPTWIVASTVYYVGLPTTVLGAFGALQQLLQRRRAAVILGLAALVPLLALAALAPFQYTANRYAFISLTSWILLASVALVELFRQTRGLGRLLAAGVLVVALASSLSDDGLYFQYQNGNREDSRAAFEFIGQRAAPGDLIVVPTKELGEYYLDRPVQLLGTFDFTRVPAGVARIWIVEDMNMARALPEQYAWVQAHAPDVANFDVHAYARNFLMRVHLYEVPGD